MRGSHPAFPPSASLSPHSSARRRASDWRQRRVISASLEQGLLNRAAHDRYTLGVVPLGHRVFSRLRCTRSAVLAGFWSRVVAPECVSPSWLVGACLLARTLGPACDPIDGLAGAARSLLAADCGRCAGRADLWTVAPESLGRYVLRRSHRRLTPWGAEPPTLRGETTGLSDPVESKVLRPTGACGSFGLLTSSTRAGVVRRQRQR